MYLPIKRSNSKAKSGILLILFVWQCWADVHHSTMSEMFQMMDKLNNMLGSMEERCAESMVYLSHTLSPPCTNSFKVCIAACTSKYY